MPSIWSRFADLPDPRTGNAQKHNLLDLLTIALTATICGAESCVDFADFARDRGALFRDFLTLPGGLPSHDTFSRLFRLLEPGRHFAACLAQFLDGLGEAGPRRYCHRRQDHCGALSIAPPASRRCMWSLRSPPTRAWSSARSPPATRRARSPRPAPCSDCSTSTARLVTGDALHCQGGTARLIQERGGDWLFTLKANRPVQHAEVARLVRRPARPPRARAHDHGRIEVRRHVATQPSTG